MKQLRAFLQPLLPVLTPRLPSALSNGKSVWLSMIGTRGFPLGFRYTRVSLLKQSLTFS